jgi:glucan-binding YG repeat protein
MVTTDGKDESYYFNREVNLLTGWQTIDGARYYFNENGVMQNQKTYIGGSWYFFSPDGKMRTDSVKYCDTMYCLDQNGKILSGWQKLPGEENYRYFDEDEDRYGAECSNLPAIMIQ